ncbi:MAG TPA: hypothetical protein VJ866_00950 [Pyrinomonadaceae bacterium]|nr:hypothetical protein [Pyrinomonadaceae bacterium]
MGRPGNNPYCHHRALELKARGLRERVVPAAPAPGLSFDHGRFDLLLETSDGRPVSSVPTSGLVQLGRAPKRTAKAAEQPLKSARTSTSARTPRKGRTKLVLCRACLRHVKSGTRACPFCGADVRASARGYRRRLHAAQDACARLPEWRRDARRVLRDCEYVREHCRRQREMLAAQREYLRALDGRHPFALGERPAREVADDEHIRAGE